MRRVSSRQRFVSWDDFDAVSRDSDSDSGIDPEDAVGNDDAPLKRKRSLLRFKQEPSHDSLPSFSEAPTLSSAAQLSSTPQAVPAFPWELNPTNAWDVLNDDLQLHIFSFCDLSAVRNMMQVNRRTRNLFVSEAASQVLWKQHLCPRQWKFLAPLLSTTTSCNVVDACRLPTFVATEQENKATNAGVVNYAMLLSLAPAHAASEVDESFFKAPSSSDVRVRWNQPYRRLRTRHFLLASALQLRIVSLPTGGTAVQYTGRVGEGDRCLRANEPLPRPQLLMLVKPDGSAVQKGCMPPFSQRSLLSRFAKNDNSRTVWRPFVVPFLGMEDGRTVLHLTPRLISYFEVTILSPSVVVDDRQPAMSTNNTRRNFHLEAHLREEEELHRARPFSTECIAVGLATEDFAFHARMPGWDFCSYGYHSDDGGIFHSYGHMLRQYGPSFGAGDTIGCGIDYVRRAIFYTKNGTFLGYAFENLSVADLQQDWYPVVGMDTPCPVQCNFGCPADGRPFVFDVYANMMQAHNSAVRQTLGCGDSLQTLST